jgi:hypothetical protein
MLSFITLQQLLLHCTCSAAPAKTTACTQGFDHTSRAKYAATRWYACCATAPRRTAWTSARRPQSMLLRSLGHLPAAQLSSNPGFAALISASELLNSTGRLEGSN